MDDTFKIYLHRLRDGHEERIEESLSPGFLDIHEADLAFKSPITLKGSVAVADETLVLTLAIETEAIMPCAICNRNVNVKILIPDFCHTENLADIKGGIFDYKEILREGILLELPYTAECNGGGCSERAALAKYFTQGK
jgi:uncharacterized metal-binding protein YceD (DUF177 family)